MKPFFFGPSAQPRFGLLHPPAGERARRAGVLLCYPGVQEYNISHWAFRKLAGLLARAGFPVLRFDWAGTGFLVNENVLLTTRRTAEIFAENRTGSWRFRPNITAWMDYRSQYQTVATAGYKVRSVIGAHDVYDVALLEVEPPQLNGTAPTPVALASLEPPRLENRPVYLIGYPVRDARRNEPEKVARIFREVYNVTGGIDAWADFDASIPKY